MERRETFAPLLREKAQGNRQKKTAKKLKKVLAFIFHLCYYTKAVT